MQGSRRDELRAAVPASRAARTLRGAIGSVAATLFAAVSHSLAGGDMTFLALAATSILALPLCVLLAGRLGSIWRLTLAVGGAQFLYHWVFAGLGSSAGATLGGTAAPAPLHAAHLAALQSFTPAATPEAAGALMWAGHAIAAALTIALLVRGERAALQLISLVRGLVGNIARAFRTGDTQPIAPLRRLLPISPALTAYARGCDPTTISRRGPPLAA